MRPKRVLYPLTVVAGVAGAIFALGVALGLVMYLVFLYLLWLAEEWWKHG
jgi:hypothetical protein